ncbi:MAG: hypothetical protein IH899_08185, partial [Planctomycetes bacterium]|nr:hypothetical protein [Planctomycetota bacterium]
SASQGEPIYLRKESYLNGKRTDSKGWHHKYRRVGLQESCPQNNFRRIIASMIPEGEFCNHKINYFPEHKSRIPLEALLAILNSKLCDWYFRLGSTNAAVSHYQLYNLPVPVISEPAKEDELSDDVEQALSERQWSDLQRLLKPQLSSPPFPRSILTVLVRLTQEIVRCETERGDITRTERSALAAEAQSCQDVIDDILYRTAGMTNQESAALEQRLMGML